MYHNLIDKKNKLHYLKVNNKLQTVVFGFINLIIQEIGMAFLPIILLELLCHIFDKSYTILTFYNNIFIGLVTLSVGNFIFLFSECKNLNKELRIVLFSENLVGFSISLIATSVTYFDSINVMPIKINNFYFEITFIIVLFISIVELLKIIKGVRRKLDVN